MLRKKYAFYADFRHCDSCLFMKHHFHPKRRKCVSFAAYDRRQTDIPISLKMTIGPEDKYPCSNWE